MTNYTGLQDYRFTLVMHIDMSVYDQYTLVYRITGLHCYYDIHVSLYYKYIMVYRITGLHSCLNFEDG